MSRGTHRLLREGATLVESPEEILEEIGVGALAGVHDASSTTTAEAIQPLHPEIQRQLQGETLNVEEIARRVSRPLTEVLVQIVELEMAGRVARTPGGLYRLVRTGL
jgi:DNA processing protein